MLPSSIGDNALSTIKAGRGISQAATIPSLLVDAPAILREIDEMAEPDVTAAAAAENMQAAAIPNLQMDEPVTLQEIDRMAEQDATAAVTAENAQAADAKAAADEVMDELSNKKKVSGAEVYEQAEHSQMRSRVHQLLQAHSRNSALQEEMNIKLQEFLELSSYAEAHRLAEAMVTDWIEYRIPMLHQFLDLPVMRSELKESLVIHDGCVATFALKCATDVMGTHWVMLQDPPLQRIEVNEVMGFSSQEIQDPATIEDSLKVSAVIASKLLLQLWCGVHKSNSSSPSLPHAVGDGGASSAATKSTVRAGQLKPGKVNSWSAQIANAVGQAELMAGILLLLLSAAMLFIEQEVFMEQAFKARHVLRSNYQLTEGDLMALGYMLLMTHPCTFTQALQAVSNLPDATGLTCASANSCSWACEFFASVWIAAFLLVEQDMDALSNIQAAQGTAIKEARQSRKSGYERQPENLPKKPKPLKSPPPSRKRPKHVDVYAGLLAFALVMSAVDIELHGMIEIDERCHELANLNFPDIHHAFDVYDEGYKHWEVEQVRILTGGPSCVPHSKAGKQGRGDDKRSTQFADMAEVAAYFDCDIVIVENVVELLECNMVMDDADQRFRALGYERTVTEVVEHDHVEGDSLRARVLLWYEKTSKIKGLPPPLIHIPQRTSSGVGKHLLPLHAIPVDTWLYGDYLLEGATELSRPPAVAKLQWGGPCSTLERGSLISIRGSDSLWRVMEVDERDTDKLHIMRSSRKHPTRISIRRMEVVAAHWQYLLVHSIDSPSKSCRAFGEWPVRNIQLLHDRRKCGLADDAPHPPGCSCVRPLLSQEGWSIQELPQDLYLEAQGLGADEDALCRLLGNSIPASILRPFAVAAERRLRQIDDAQAGRPHSHAAAVKEEAVTVRTELVLYDISSDTLFCEESQDEWHYPVTYDSLPFSREQSEAKSAALLKPFLSGEKKVHVYLAGERLEGVELHRVYVAPIDRQCQDEWFSDMEGKWIGINDLQQAQIRAALLAKMAIARFSQSAIEASIHDTQRIFNTGADPASRVRSESLGADTHQGAFHESVMQSEEWVKQTRARLLEEEAKVGDGYFAGWAEACSNAPPISEIPEGFQLQEGTYDDERLAKLPYIHRCIPPTTNPLPPAQPQPDPPSHFHPTSVEDLVYPIVFQKLIPEWVEAQLQDLRRYKQFGPDAVRQHNKPLAIGQDLFRPDARGIVWDLRKLKEGIITPLDFTQPITTHLSLEFLREELKDFVDQELLSFLCSGVVLKADLELQLVFLPHLMSLSHGVDSVESELKKLAAKGWYGLFEHLPFLPCRVQPQGAVPRKLEERWRRVMEAGAPRKMLFDTAGLSVVPLNLASRGVRSVHRDDYDNMTAEEQERVYKDMCRCDLWPNELKPRCADLAHDGAILRQCAACCTPALPVLALTDDFSNFFHQFALASSEYFKVCVLYLPLDEAHQEHSYCVEYCLAMGLFQSSGIAQRFAHGLLDIFNRAMHKAETECTDQEPEVAAWLDTRRQISHEENQARAWTHHIYTDDSMLITVGISRFIRMLYAWRYATAGCNILMAIPQKRCFGTAIPALGAYVYFSHGLIIIPRHKIVRALSMLRQLIQCSLTYGDYRSLLGLLEHFVLLNQARRNVMYGLYAGLSDSADPADYVLPSRLIVKQATRWMELLLSRCGCNFFDVLPNAPSPQTVEFSYHVYSDAALQGAPIPSLGGYFHGVWWTLPLELRYQRIPIAHLEFAAGIITFVMFVRHVIDLDSSPDLIRCWICLHVDGLATDLALSYDSARSPVMQQLHLYVMSLPEFQHTSFALWVQHIFGEGNIMADAASRGYFSVLNEMAAQLRLRLTQLQVPDDMHALLAQLYEWVADTDLLAHEGPDEWYLKRKRKTKSIRRNRPYPEQRDPTKGYPEEGPFASQLDLSYARGWPEDEGDQPFVPDTTAWRTEAVNNNWRPVNAQNPNTLYAHYCDSGCGQLFHYDVSKAGQTRTNIFWARNEGPQRPQSDQPLLDESHHHSCALLVATDALQRMFHYLEQHGTWDQGVYRGACDYDYWYDLRSRWWFPLESKWMHKAFYPGEAKMTAGYLRARDYTLSTMRVQSKHGVLVGNTYVMHQGKYCTKNGAYKQADVETVHLMQKLHLLREMVRRALSASNPQALVASERNHTERERRYGRVDPKPWQWFEYDGCYSDDPRDETHCTDLYEFLEKLRATAPDVAPNRCSQPRAPYTCVPRQPTSPPYLMHHPSDGGERYSYASTPYSSYDPRMPTLRKYAPVAIVPPRLAGFTGMDLGVVLDRWWTIVNTAEVDDQKWNADLVVQVCADPYPHTTFDGQCTPERTFVLSPGQQISFLLPPRKILLCVKPLDRQIRFEVSLENCVNEAPDGTSAALRSAWWSKVPLQVARKNQRGNIPVKYPHLLFNDVYDIVGNPVVKIQPFAPPRHYSQSANPYSVIDCRRPAYYNPPFVDYFAPPGTCSHDTRAARAPETPNPVPSGTEHHPWPKPLVPPPRSANAEQSYRTFVTKKRQRVHDEHMLIRSIRQRERGHGSFQLSSDEDSDSNAARARREVHDAHRFTRGLTESERGHGRGFSSDEDADGPTSLLQTFLSRNDNRRSLSSSPMTASAVSSLLWFTPTPQLPPAAPTAVLVLQPPPAVPHTTPVMSDAQVDLTAMPRSPLPAASSIFSECTSPVVISDSTPASRQLVSPKVDLARVLRKRKRHIATHQRSPMFLHGLPSVSSTAPDVCSDFIQMTLGTPVVGDVSQRLLSMLKLDTSPFALRPQNADVMWAMVADMATCAALGYTQSTYHKDILHWNQYWCPFCVSLNTPAWRCDPMVSSALCPLARERESFLNTLFIFHVKRIIKPKSHADAEAKPASVVAPLNAMRRMHKNKGYELCLVPASMISSVVKGMKRQFMQRWGYTSLLPKRKEYIPVPVILLLFTLHQASDLSAPRVGRVTLDISSLLWVNFYIAMALCLNTGYRKAEIAVAYWDTFDANHLSCANYCWLHGDVEYDILPPHLVAAPTSLLVLCVRPPPAKADQFGEKYGNYYSYIRWDDDPRNLAYWLIVRERMDPIPLDERMSTPFIYFGAGRQPWSHSKLDTTFRNLLAAVSRLHPLVLPVEHLSRYSWHSWRVTLATLLSAALVPRHTIMRMLRWASEQSLDVYCRPTSTEMTQHLDAAMAQRHQPAALVVNREQHVADLAKKLMAALSVNHTTVAAMSEADVPLEDDSFFYEALDTASFVQ